MPMTPAPQVGSREASLCTDAAVRYEERKLAILRWCKGSVAMPSERPPRAGPVIPESPRPRSDWWLKALHQ